MTGARFGVFLVPEAEDAGRTVPSAFASPRTWPTSSG